MPGHVDLEESSVGFLYGLLPSICTRSGSRARTNDQVPEASAVFPLAGHGLQDPNSRLLISFFFLSGPNTKHAR